MYFGVRSKYLHILCNYSQERSDTCPDEPEKDWYVCKSLVCEHESTCIIAAKDCYSSSSNLFGTQPTFNSTPTAPLNSATKVSCATPLTFEL